MVYQFRVTLPGIKGFYRVYRVNSNNTFYSFHKQLQADLSFPSDQPILFKAYDKAQGVIARYALVDLGFGAVDDVSIGFSIAQGAESFDYYYDTKAKKRIIITLEEVIPGNEIAIPTLLNDSKGPDPIAFDNGFVAFEDLPREKRTLPGEQFDLDDDVEIDDDSDEDEEEDEEEYLVDEE